MSGGALLATDLQQAIERCRGTLLVASGSALEPGWVKAEYNSSMDERANHPDFRVVALRLAGANTKELMKGTTWIDVPGKNLDVNTALAIVRSCYPKENWPEPSVARDVYVSCSWRSDDSSSARTACEALVQQGLRLIGDAKDQKGFGSGDRVQRIIASCGALVSIIPFRDEPSARLDGGPYKYMLRELDTAVGLGMPALVIADPRVRREDGSDASWLRMETVATECPGAVASAIETLSEDWETPPRPQYVFLALDLDGAAALPHHHADAVFDSGLVSEPSVRRVQSPSIDLGIVRNHAGAGRYGADDLHLVRTHVVPRRYFTANLRIARARVAQDIAPSWEGKAPLKCRTIKVTFRIVPP